VHEALLLLDRGLLLVLPSLILLLFLGVWLGLFGTLLLLVHHLDQVLKLEVHASTLQLEQDPLGQFLSEFLVRAQPNQSLFEERDLRFEDLIFLLEMVVFAFAFVFLVGGDLGSHPLGSGLLRVGRKGGGVLVRQVLEHLQRR